MASKPGIDRDEGSPEDGDDVELGRQKSILEEAPIEHAEEFSETPRPDKLARQEP